MPNQVPIIQSSMTFAQTDKVDGIQYIGFAHSIEASEAVQSRRKIKGLRRVTFKIGKFEPS